MNTEHSGDPVRNNGKYAGVFAVVLPRLWKKQLIRSYYRSQE